MKHEDVKIGMKVVLKDDPCKTVREITGPFHDSTWVAIDPQTSHKFLCYASDFEPYLESNREGKMSKLKMKVAVFEKAIVVQILEMDERFRSSDLKTKKFMSKDFSINSDGRVELSSSCLYLRGSKQEMDNKVSFRQFNSNGERDDYLVKMKQALTDWAENWEGWKEKKEESEAKDSDIWEF